MTLKPEHALLVCPKCTKKNRIRMDVRTRCGHCKHAFTPADLVKAVVETPILNKVAPSDVPMFGDDDDVTHECKDDDDCGWEGNEEDLEDGRCPDCGKKVKRIPRNDNGEEPDAE